MANHYYTKNPESISQQKHWTYRLKGNTLSFTSDNGVFSKNTVDFGSELLVEFIMWIYMKVICMIL